MKKASKNMDIRIIKYEGYVKKHPRKAYGYYCLGKLNLISGQYKAAEDNFQKALTIDNKHTVSRVGLIECYIFQNKFLKAVYLFSKYRQEINSKYIYKVKLMRGVSSFYSKSDLFTKKSKSIFSILFLKYTMYYIKELVKKESHNIILKLLLCMHYLNSDERNPYVVQMFKTCVYWEGLDDSMRWALLKNLGDSGEKLFYDVNIARKFTAIPSTGCSDEYINMILGAALVNGNRVKVSAIYDSVNKHNMKLSPNILWTYIHWSRENAIYDHSVYDCCKKLIKCGWMDKLIAEMLIKVREKNIVKFSDEEERILRLYDYVN